MPGISFVILFVQQLLSGKMWAFMHTLYPVYSALYVISILHLPKWQEMSKIAPELVSVHS